MRSSQSGTAPGRDQLPKMLLSSSPGIQNAYRLLVVRSLRCYLPASHDEGSVCMSEAIVQAEQRTRAPRQVDMPPDSAQRVLDA